MKYAAVAVSDVTYWVDRPYSYRIPEQMEASVVPGVRVAVPFSRGNRRAEGLVLRVTDRIDIEKPKCIQEVLDGAPILDGQQLELALWMRERFFCTVYEAAKAMLPAGLWFRSDGSRRASDKLTEWARLAVPAEEALAIAGARGARARQQGAVLRLLSAVGEAATADIRAMTGAGRASITALRDGGMVELFFREEFRRPVYRTGEARQSLPELTAEQAEVCGGLLALRRRGERACALLHGVTGSGKTAVYLHLIRDTLDSGRSAMLLVPEIALTPQMLETFSSYFGDNIAVMHSSLTAAERYDEWKRLRAGLAKLVIGTRSAVFAPLENPGLLIIDEEHEETYKSENAPRYHARDVAMYRCSQSGALLVLGSATPDVVTRRQAETGAYSYFSLATRYNRMQLPEVRVVDMKQELRSGNGSGISALLREELQRNIDRGGQSILFLNRRGTAKLVCCPDCGFTFQCPNCSVNLTYHAGTKRLLCHSCGYQRPLTQSCPDCGGLLRFTGDGTEKVQERLEKLFPGTGILRADVDTVGEAGGHGALFRRFREEKIPILVGTQMIAKGLNFDGVTLVGVMLADQTLYAGSYLASQRTFSLLTQVIGRGGRADKAGRAVIQTYTPEHQVIRCAARQDYDSFYRSELELRRVQQSPPFTRLIGLTVTGGDESQVLRCCGHVRELLLHGLAGETGADVLGPAPYPVVKVLGRFRYKLTLRCLPDQKVHGVVSRVLLHCNTEKEFRGVSVYADRNPLD